MKLIPIILVSLALGFTTLSVRANETKDVKAYPLDTCLVCGMNLGMMKPYTFVYKGQEIKVCSEDEKTAFEANPDLYLKKLIDAKTSDKKNK
jgi:YHS domain-containing protein